MPQLQPAPGASDERLDERALARLQWRCRRGLLENDIFITRFFERHGAGLTRAQAQAIETLMDLADNDLLDLLLRRKEPEPAWAGAEVAAVLELMRPPGDRLAA
ncbi:succinate dehydrogenase assembly factor 2 [Pseudacidovorax intermedius]|uniref:FAD assembly factor SdhE n=1 Tax=Pseudacidovorax intermedius TaxID=433924 RepID=A0A370FJE7_9BURK|nr:succinate dehydrogenase assembly factor 2 [Pseudacidovorax intermedius]RDI25919.1 antitoxin CptB [Pseudacidovorax intermedius]